METDPYKGIRILGWLVATVVIVVCGWMVASSVIATRGTGFLYISSSDPKASLVISQPDRQAYLAGVGSAKTRLDPGSYNILVSDGIKQSSTTATVDKQRTTDVSLDPTHIVRLPSLESIDFKGMDALKNVGVTDSQVSNLEQELFQYKPRTQTVSIDGSSVQRQHYNPAYDSSFKIDFGLTVDSTPYTATISYTDLYYVHLLLYTKAGHNLVFDSAKVNNPLSGE